MAKLPKALNLSDVLLGDVKISEKITSGTFVRVFKVYHKETIFAAKVFFYSDSTVNRDTGFDTKGNPRNENAKRLLQECHRCKKLDHSNVIRLIGLHYKEKSAVPTLIVEKLRETLNYFLVKNSDVEFACKLSILLDVAKGLMYLHSQDPQIAHGCLTSKNVLLTDQRRAKITGDSAVTSLLKQTTSRRPTQTYGLEVSADFFPCETRADRDSHGVDPCTDVFSYGGIILHTLTQMWPKPESRVSCRGHAGKPISEIDRRRKYFADIDDHRFEELVKSCMDDDSRVRLTIVKVHAILQKIECEEMLPPPAPATKDSVRHSASEDTGTARQNSQRSNGKVDVDKEVKQILKQKDDIIKKQQDLIQQKDHLIEEKDEEIKQLKKSLQESKNQLRETSNPIGSDQKQTKVEHKKTQTDEDIQKNQLFSQEQRIKYQQENSLHEQTILPHAEKCEVESLPEYAVANKAVSTTVILKDIQGRPITNCSDSINMKMQNTSTKQIAPLTIFDVKELENGQYYLQFIIEEIGGYKLYIFFNEHIIKASCRIRCLHIPQNAIDPNIGMRPIKPLQNATATSCYFNSVLQVLNQTTGLIKMMLKYGENVKRPYSVLYKNEKQKVEMELPIELSSLDNHTLLYTLKFYLKEVVSENNVVLRPDFVLFRLIENSSFKSQRSLENTQEDSHELLRYLLYELKKEEVDLVKKEAKAVLESNLGNIYLDEHDKAAEKNFLRNASKKITTPIEEVFGGVKLNTVICRTCETPLQTNEPFFDISLGLPAPKEEKRFNSVRQNSKQSVTPLWQPEKQYGRANQVQQNFNSTYSVNSSYHYTTVAQSSTNACVIHKVSDGYDKKSVQNLLMLKDNEKTKDTEKRELENEKDKGKWKGKETKPEPFYYQPVLGEDKPGPANDVEDSLADHTDVDNMDENNKFICKECTRKKGPSAGRDEVQLCLVTKQILIHQLPQVLILHFKRFNIAAYMVTKDSTHVTFSSILNMAPYCSNKCLKDYGDSNGDILYSLYGVVEHVGQTLQSGHYIAYVKRRLEMQQSPNPGKKNGWLYDHKAAHDGKWFYTSDLTIRECSFEEVQKSNAYMLFYELLPWKNTTLV